MMRKSSFVLAFALAAGGLPAADIAPAPEGRQGGLPSKELSDLLGAVNGAAGRRDVDVYAVLSDGVYLYAAESNLLTPVNAGDHRATLARLLKLHDDRRVMLVQVLDPVRADGMTPPDGLIGEERAKRIALGDAKLAERELRKLSVELERKKGRQVYDVEFEAGLREYEYRIDARTGAIVESRREWD